MLPHGLLRESARPISERIRQHIEDCAREGRLFTTDEVLKRVEKWKPMRDAVVGISNAYGQLGLPAVVHYGLMQFVHSELGLAHPRLGIPKYSGLPIVGVAGKAFKDSEYLTANEIRSRVIPLQRSASGALAVIAKYLELADALDEFEVTNLRELLSTDEYATRKAS